MLRAPLKNFWAHWAAKCIKSKLDIEILLDISIKVYNCASIEKKSIGCSIGNPRCLQAFAR